MTRQLILCVLLATAIFGCKPDVKYTTEQIDELSKSMLENTGMYGINQEKAKEYISAVESFAKSNPDDANTPLYINKAGDLARSMQQYTRAIKLFDKLVEDYPDHERVPSTLFLKGFMLENELKQTDKARDTYKTFIKMFPSHDLTDDVQFLLDNIEKSDEEILKIIEGKRK